MLPEYTVFPEFVPDQVLSSDNLNDMFGYLDEQGRLTRSNLIGIGIVCGLQVKTASNGITITKGVGVTSAGYLVRMETDVTYRAYKPFDAVKEEYYDKFVNINPNPKTQKFDLLELKENKTEAGSGSLSALSLGNYVVLLFVELLQEQNKNCDPNSCDDKGINIENTIRPLLVSSLPANFTNLNSLIGNNGNPQVFNHRFYEMEELKMPRYLVPNTSPIRSSEDVLQGYVNIFTESFLNKVENTLTFAYTATRNLLGSSETNPFIRLKEDFDFIRSIPTKEQLLHLQYYYDIISDILQAYDEFRKLGNSLLSKCCPNPSLYPRHLLLGEAVPVTTMTTSFRHYFIYSRLFERKNLLLELKFLFSRMQVMTNKLNLTIPPFAPDGPRGGTRITPSLLSDAPLSQKSIPYYYKYDPLYPAWNFDKTLRRKENQNLCYHVPAATPENFVSAPLRFDLEPFNFLRIEGHIGRRFQDVFQEIKSIKRNSRLPIDVIALSTGQPDLRKIADGSVNCNFRDLQLTYEIIRREWEAVIGKMIEYLDDNQRQARPLFNEASVGSDVFGDYRRLLINAKRFMVADLNVFISKFDEFVIDIYEKIETDSLFMRSVLVDFIANNDVINENLTLKQFIQGENQTRKKITLAEDLIDHFDEVILSCKKGGFRTIFQQFYSRIHELYTNMFFGNFVEKNPGIQHKAGVTMGGTFILVYHKKPELTDGKGPFTIKGFVLRETGLPPKFAKVYVDTIALTRRETQINPVDGSFTLDVDTLPAVFKAEALSEIIGSRSIEAQAGELLVTSPRQFVVIQVPSSPVIVHSTTNNVYNALRDDEVIADFYLPYICSSNCTPIQFVIHETVNLRPVANAGPDQSFDLPRNSTTLDGSKSTDPEDKPLTYSWALISGQQNVVFADTTAEKPAVSNLIEPGQYIFELTVTDQSGTSSHSDQVVITVNPEPNVVPVANAGEDDSIRQPATTYILNGQGADPDGNETELSYEWSLVSRPTGSTGSVSFSDARAKQTTASNLTSIGQYIFRLTVTDSRLATGTDDIIITVLPEINLPPVADPGGPVNLVLPDTFVELDGTASFDPEGKGLTFFWENMGPALKIFRKTSDRPIVFDLVQTGTYKVRLTVKDNIQQPNSSDLNIRVTGRRRIDNCLTADSIGSNFPGFIENNSPVFAEFKGAFPAIDEVTEYFKVFNDRKLDQLTLPEKLDFFLEFRIAVNDDGTRVRVPIVEALQIWLSSLFVLLQDEGSNRRIRTFVIALFNILIQLATYITCIQRGGPNDRKVDTLELFQMIHDMFASLDPDFFQKFEQEQVMLLMRFRALIDDEIFLIESTGQTTLKKDYHRVLQQIRFVLDSLLDV